MATERPRQGKFPKLVSHHILGNVDRDKFIPIMNGNRMTDKVWRNH